MAAKRPPEAFADLFLFLQIICRILFSVCVRLLHVCHVSLATTRKQLCLPEPLFGSFSTEKCLTSRHLHLNLTVFHLRSEGDASC